MSQDEAKNPGKRSGHSVAGSAVDQANVSPEVKLAQQRVQEHQAGCPKLSWPEEVRTIMAQKSGFATISTISTKHEGFPMGSTVGFAADSKGRPYFSFSALSAHTQNLMANPKASLCVTEPKFKGAADARVTLIGSVSMVNGEEADALRKEYMQAHPGAYWAEFKDFNVFRMDKIEDVSFVGGFARAGSVTVDEYMAAEADPLQAFADPVMNHMNLDHTDALKEYVTYLVRSPSPQMRRASRGFFTLMAPPGPWHSGVPFAISVDGCAQRLVLILRCACRSASRAVWIRL